MSLKKVAVLKPKPRKPLPKKAHKKPAPKKCTRRPIAR